MSWAALASDSPIVVPAGTSVAVVASVKASHTAADLQAFAAKRGLVLSDYAEEGQRPGLGPDPRAPDYHYVSAIWTASEDVSLPWEVPWPASLFDDSQIVSAWLGTANASPPTPPAPETPRAADPGSIWPTVFVGAVLVVLAIEEHVRSRRRAFARR